MAQRYLKQCTGVWVVAAINRAVDDKAAKTLLGESFRRQLKYDGGFSGVTFICSKTDDISITEAIESLDLQDQTIELEQELDKYTQQIEDIQSKVVEFQESSKVYKATALNTLGDIEVWKRLQADVKSGKPAFAPVSNNKKRKNDVAAEEPRKKLQLEENEPEDKDFTSRQDEPESKHEAAPPRRTNAAI